jgi:hypothetical protein
MVNEPQAAEAAEANFVEELCIAFPSLAMARDAALRATGEVVPYAFMADVGRHVEGLHAAAELEGAQVGEELARLCAFLSGAHAAGGDDVRQLVEAAFLLSLDAPSPSYAGLRHLLGPGLRAAVEAAWPGVDFR